MAQIDRRTMLKRSALGAGGLAVVGFGGSSLLAACGGDDSDSSSSSGSGSSSGGFGTLEYQLSWIKNVEFAGTYLADKNGYYEDEGFSGVNIVAGGPSVSPDPIVAAGSAFVSLSAPDLSGPAIIEGAPNIAIGAQFQKNPFAVMSMADNPIPTPEDMIGKAIGVQAVNEPIWAAFLQANEIDPADINKVTVQFDPTPLVEGEVDGWFSFFTNEPNLLRAEGLEVEVFLLDEFNYPLVSEIYVVRKDSVENERDKVKALLRADIRGWHDVIADPEEAARVTVEEYADPGSLTVEEQTLEAIDQNTLIVTDDTTANGIFTITPELIEESIATLALGGIEIAAEDLFDTSIIDEVYEENPELKELPT